MSLRAALKQVEKTTGQTPAELLGDESLPLELAHVWDWFLELSGARPSGFAGVEPITFGELDAWSRLTGQQPTVDEVAALRRLDVSFRRVMSEV